MNRTASPSRPSRFGHFASNFRKAPLELKAFAVFCILAWGYVCVVSFIMPAVLAYAQGADFYAAYALSDKLLSHTSILAPAAYGSVIFFACATIHYRSLRVRLGMILMTFMALLMGIASFAIEMQTNPLGGARPEFLPHRILFTLVIPLFWCGVVLSPRIKAFCDKSEENEGI